MIDIATVIVIALPSFALGAFLGHTLLRPKGEEIANLRAENRDLHIDIAEKAARLAKAGLQSAGGVDAA